MKNSIEEALKKLSTGKKIKMYELLRTFKKEGIENFVITRKKYVDVILSDYERVLKENEQLSTEVNSLKKENEELKSENRRLKVIRYSTEYGTENIHLITKIDLAEINTNKYFIEIQDGKFVDLKQVYQENEKLNEYKDNYISIQKIKDKIEKLNSESYAEKLEDIMNIKNYTITELVQYVLQELIEGRK